MGALAHIAPNIMVHSVQCAQAGGKSKRGTASPWLFCFGMPLHLFKAFLVGRVAAWIEHDFSERWSRPKLVVSARSPPHQVGTSQSWKVVDVVTSNMYSTSRRPNDAS